MDGYGFFKNEKLFLKNIRPFKWYAKLGDQDLIKELRI